MPTPKSVYYLFRRLFSCIRRIAKRKNDAARSNDRNAPFPTITHPAGQAIRAQNYNGNGIITTGNRLATGEHAGHTTNGRPRQGSFDMSQTLTYRKVMSRVIKRFLLNKQREEQEEIREGDFEELKQDIQMLRIEMLHQLDKTREELCTHGQLLNEGVVVVGELLTAIDDKSGSLTDNFHMFKKNFYAQTDSGIHSNTSTLSTTSRQSLIRPTHSASIIRHSKTSPNLSNNSQYESDINPIDIVKHLSVAHIKLSDIKEEEDEKSHKKLKFIDDDDDDNENEQDNTNNPQKSPEFSVNNDTTFRERY